MAENKLVSNGIYSIMNNSWIKEPVQAKIPDLDKEAFNKEFKIWEDRYNEIIDLEEEIHTPQIDEIDSFLDDVYVMRQNSLNTEGEYGIGNLVFKELRNKGYLDKLKEMRNELVSKELSLKEGAITGNIRDISRDELVKLEKALYDFLAEDQLYPEDGTFNKGRLTDFELVLYIDGDWKHDHLATEQAVEDFCDIYNLTIVSHNQRTIGDSDSDSYRAEHKWQIEIDEDGNTKDTVNSLKKMFATESITEDTIKRNGKWVNKGKDGTHGTFKTKKAADAQRNAMFASGYHEDLAERLDERQRRQYREEIGRISHNQVILQDNGLFNIYNVKEYDADTAIRQLRNLDYIDWVNKTAGKYDFSKVVMFGQPQPRYYNITGKIKD